MRTLITIFALAFLLGCKTTPEDVAFKATGATVLTVNGALSGWLDYKNTHAVPSNQVAKVREAYERYHETVKAQRAAIFAFKENGDTNGLNRAIVLSSTTAAQLIRIVLAYLPPEEAAKLKGIR